MHDYRVPSGRAGRLGPRPPRGLVGLASAALAIAATGLVIAARTESSPSLTSATGRPLIPSRVTLYAAQSPTRAVVVPGPLCVSGGGSAAVTDLRWVSDSGITISDKAVRVRLLGDATASRVAGSLDELGLDSADPADPAIRVPCAPAADATTPVAELALDVSLTNPFVSARATGLQVTYVVGESPGRLTIPVTVQICSPRFDVGESCDAEAKPPKITGD